jgi:hypothetical protein
MRAIACACGAALSAPRTRRVPCCLNELTAHALTTRRAQRYVVMIACDKPDQSMADQVLFLSGYKLTGDHVLEVRLQSPVWHPVPTPTAAASDANVCLTRPPRAQSHSLAKRRGDYRNLFEVIPIVNVEGGPHQRYAQHRAAPSADSRSHVAHRRPCAPACSIRLRNLKYNEASSRAALTVRRSDG